jgi:anti-sigma-K factor RskA
LSPGVSHFRWFSLGYAVNFAVSIFLLSAQLRFVRASNGKPLITTLKDINSYFVFVTTLEDRTADILSGSSALFFFTHQD